MNQIGNINFDFSMADESFARSLYGRWETFFAQKIEPIADELLHRFDVESDYIEIKELNIEIGELNEEEFDERFPLIFREKLEEALLKCLSQPQQTGISVKKISKTENACNLLFYFLIHGSLPWTTPPAYRDLHTLFMEVIRSEGQRHKYFLFTHGHSSDLQQRLVYQFDDKALEAGVRLLNSSEGDFICSYVSLLNQRHRQSPAAAVSAADHRTMVWTVVYSYLLNDTDSHFNRKSFLSHTISRLATAHNTTYELLLQSLTGHLEALSDVSPSSAGLLSILLELRHAWEEKQTVIDSHFTYTPSALIEKMKRGGIKTLNEEEILALREILSRPQSYQTLLQGMDESQIEKLLLFFASHQKDFIDSFVQVFGDFLNSLFFVRATTSAETRWLRWIAIFPLIVNSLPSELTRSDFVYQVLRNVADYYHLNINFVLKSFLRYAETIEPDKSLKPVFDSLNNKSANTDKQGVSTNQTSKEETNKHTERLPDGSKDKGSNNIQNSNTMTIDMEKQETVYISNAGLILLAPYLSRLFEMLSLSKDGQWIGREEQIRAIFLLQYLVFGDKQAQYPEHELLLNKILVNLENKEPIGTSPEPELTEEECNTAESLLNGVLQHWSKLKNTSVAGLREAFLQREGKLELKEDGIHLTVETKTYDMLLDSVPWNFRMVKFSWMKQAVLVDWR